MTIIGMVVAYLVLRRRYPHWSRLKTAVVAVPTGWIGTYVVIYLAFVVLELLAGMAPLVAEPTPTPTPKPTNTPTPRPVVCGSRLTLIDESLYGSFHTSEIIGVIEGMGLCDEDVRITLRDQPPEYFDGKNRAAFMQAVPAQKEHRFIVIVFLPDIPWGRAEREFDFPSACGDLTTADGWLSSNLMHELRHVWQFVYEPPLAASDAPSERDADEWACSNYVHMLHWV